MQGMSGGGQTIEYFCCFIQYDPNTNICCPFCIQTKNRLAILEEVAEADKGGGKVIIARKLPVSQFSITFD